MQHEIEKAKCRQFQEKMKIARTEVLNSIYDTPQYKEANSCLAELDKLAQSLSGLNGDKLNEALALVDNTDARCIGLVKTLRKTKPFKSLTLYCKEYYSSQNETRCLERNVEFLRETTGIFTMDSRYW